MTNTVKRIIMPPSVFVKAVHLAGAVATYEQEPTAAVRQLTDWWNEHAAPEWQCAYGIGLYLNSMGAWFSGTPEEGWVTDVAYEKNESPLAEVELLDGKMVIGFLREPIDETEHSFDAKMVDGSDGVDGGQGHFPSHTGKEIINYMSHEILNVFPLRFPEQWRDLCFSVLKDK